MCEMEEHVMFAFITENLGTIVVGVLMLVAVTGIFAGLIKSAGAESLSDATAAIAPRHPFVTRNNYRNSLSGFHSVYRKQSQTARHRFQYRLRAVSAVFIPLLSIVIYSIC